MTRSRKLYLCDIPDWLNDPAEIETRIRQAARMMYVDLNCYNIEIDDHPRFLYNGRAVYAVRRSVENVVESL